MKVFISLRNDSEREYKVVSFSFVEGLIGQATLNGIEVNART